jgi:hypothetical protein
MSPEFDSPGNASEAAELDAERRWQERFAHSADLLAKLADEALAEYREGRTQPLDPDML